MFDFPQYGYLVILLVSLLGTWTLDRKYKLAFYANARAAWLVTAFTVGFLLVFDVVGIYLDIFSTNEAYTVGVNLFSKDLPIEELLLLGLISHTTLLICRKLDHVRI